MIEVQAVLRNTVIRKDAVYVLEIESLDPRYTLTAYWGKWPVWLEHGKSRLQSQKKATTSSIEGCIRVMGDILLKKLAKGYVIQEERSQTPGWYVDRHGYTMRRREPLLTQAFPETKIAPEPQMPVSRWNALEL